jgi:hypothetical protein
VGVQEAGDLLDTGAPSGKRLVALARIGADRHRAADMVQHDPRLRECAREIGEPGNRMRPVDATRDPGGAG